MGRLKAHPAQHDGNELDKCVGTYWKLKKTDRVCIFQARIIKKNNFIFFYNINLIYLFNLFIYPLSVLSANFVLIFGIV